MIFLDKFIPTYSRLAGRRLSTTELVERIDIVSSIKKFSEEVRCSMRPLKIYRSSAEASLYL